MLRGQKQGESVLDRIARHTRREGDCLIWTGATDGHFGYGRMTPRTSARQAVNVHRIVWEAYHGPVPAGLHVRHHCDVPACVEITHLAVGTVADNMRDRDSRGRNGQRKKTHCPRGHEYTKENTRMYGSGRICRACDRLRWQEGRHLPTKRGC